MIVVTSGEKSGEISGANQYWSSTFCARSKETEGDIMVTVLPSVVTVANEGMSIRAEEPVACVTVTG
jgi:hypothetical protein